MNVMKRIILIVVVVIMTFALCSCKGGISSEEAKATTNEFFNALETGDYEKASQLSHPDVYSTADRIEAFVDAISDKLKVDFTDIEIKKYTGFSSSYYTSDVGGSRYELQMDLIINDLPVEAEVEIVRNDNGYGVSNIEIDAD